MARSQGDILQLQIGGLVMQLADAMSRLEAAQEANQKLQEELAKLKPPQEESKSVREPDKIGPLAAAENHVARALQEVKK